MKNGNGKDYANKHPDESKASEVASILDMKLPKLGTPRKPLTIKEKEELKKKGQGIVEPKFIDSL